MSWRCTGAAATSSLARGFNPDLVVLTTAFAGGPQAVHAIWRDLLRGARGLVLWDEGGGFLDAEGGPGPRGRSLAPTFAELREGLAAQLIAATPRRDPVAILYSQASFRTRWLLDRRADGRPWVAMDSAAEWDDATPWRRAMEAALRTLAQAGLQPRFVSDAMVAAGALRAGALDGGVRLVLLPQALALSPDAAAALRDFVAGGGVLVADAEPGRFDAHARHLDEPLLAGAALHRVAAFSPAALQPLWRAAGLAALRLTRPDGSAPEDVQIRVWHTGAVVLLGLQRDLPATGVPAPAEDVDLALDAPLLVRDLRRPAPPVRTDRLTIRLDGVEPTLLALSPERLPAPVISGPAVLAAGAVAAVQVALAGPPLAGAPPAGAHAVRLECGRSARCARAGARGDAAGRCRAAGSGRCGRRPAICRGAGASAPPTGWAGRWRPGRSSCRRPEGRAIG